MCVCVGRGRARWGRQGCYGQIVDASRGGREADADGDRGTGSAMQHFRNKVAAIVGSGKRSHTRQK